MLSGVFYSKHNHDYIKTELDGSMYSENLSQISSKRVALNWKLNKHCQHWIYPSNVGNFRALTQKEM